MICDGVVGGGDAICVSPHLIVDHDDALEDAEGLSCWQFLAPFWIYALDATLSVKKSAVGYGSILFGAARIAAVVVI